MKNLAALPSRYGIEIPQRKFKSNPSLNKAVVDDNFCGPLGLTRLKLSDFYGHWKYYYLDIHERLGDFITDRYDISVLAHWYNQSNLQTLPLTSLMDSYWLR